MLTRNKSKRRDSRVIDDSDAAECHPMRMLQFLMALAGVKAVLKKGSRQFWDEWWSEKASSASISRYFYPMLEAPLVRYRHALIDVANSDELLITLMLDHGLNEFRVQGTATHRSLGPSHRFRCHCAGHFADGFQKGNGVSVGSPWRQLFLSPRSRTSR